MQDNQYYILKPAVGTEETGMAFPAVESYDDYDFDGPNSVYKLDSDFFPDFVPDIRFKLAKGAKLCDIMGQATISACGLLISPRLKDIFDQFNIVPHRYYLANIETKGVLHQYYWMHIVWNDGINHLVFKDSKFQINEFGDNLGDLEISSYKDLLDKQTELGFMKMIFNYNSVMFNIVFDVFTHPLNKTIYLSENIYNTIMHKNLTGIDTFIAALSVRQIQI